jgi:hypothetical protein
MRNKLFSSEFDDPKQNRNGTHLDDQRVEKTFKSLGFLVFKKFNCTKKVRITEKISKRWSSQNNKFKVVISASVTIAFYLSLLHLLTLPYTSPFTSPIYLPLVA